MGSTTEDWQSIATAHQLKQLYAIPQEWKLDDEALKKLAGDGTVDVGRLIKLQAAKLSGIMSEGELHITEAYTATQLLDLMAEGKLKALDVTTAFSKRAAIAQQLVSLHFAAQCCNMLCAQCRLLTRYKRHRASRKSSLMKALNGRNGWINSTRITAVS